MITYKEAKIKAVFHRSAVNMAVEYKDAWEFCAMKDNQPDGMPFFIMKEDGALVEFTDYMIKADEDATWDRIDFSTGAKI